MKVIVSLTTVGAADGLCSANENTNRNKNDKIELYSPLLSIQTYKPRIWKYLAFKGDLLDSKLFYWTFSSLKTLYCYPATAGESLWKILPEDIF